MKLVFAELMIWFAYLVITKFIDASRQNDRERRAEGYDK
jgi:hypothetical protein